MPDPNPPAPLSADDLRDARDDQAESVNNP